ncbi:MAG: hypothetical protein ACLP4V_08580 [Methylocella sp.]
MRIEFMPGMTNVARFPLEVRVEPSLELLLDIAPDCREVDLVAEAFDLDRCLHEARGAADLAMAEHILNNVPPERGARRRLALDRLLQPLIGQAVDACRLAHRAGEVARRANQRLVEAQIEGGYWIDALKENATEKSNEAARRLIEAHIASEEAQGAARAVSIAKRGEEWRPFNLRAEEEASFLGAAST